MNNDSPSPQPSLLRALGLVMATAVVVGTVIGSGIFKKPQVVADNVPYFGLVALVWVLGGVIVLLGSLAYAEVAVLYPKAGGNYVFLREGYGRMAGFLWGWVDFCIIRSGSIAALATIFSESLHNVLANPAFQKAVGLELGSRPLGYWSERALTVAVILGLALVNVRGVRWGGWLQLLITTVKVASLLAIIALPFLAYRLATAEADVPLPRTENWTPVWPDSLSLINWGAFGTALVGVQWAYHGWMNIAPVAEEVRRPQRNIPLSLFIGVFIIITLYLGANFAYYLILPGSKMAGLKSTTVATEFSLRLLGPIGAAAASAAVMMSVFGALNGNLLVGPRLLYAMGEDRLAPRALSTVHPIYRTPWLAIIVLAAWSSVLVIGVAVVTEILPHLKGKPHFDIMTDLAMFGAVIFETLAVATVFVFRWRYPDAERPYRCLGYPVVPILYVVILTLIVLNMFLEQTTEALTGIGFIAAGVCVYLLWLRSGSKPDDKIPSLS